MTTPGQAPTIETSRTVMRAHRLDDFEAYAAMAADPVVTRFTGRQRTREESWLRFLRHQSLWSMLGYGYWAVTLKGNDRFIGEVGFHDMRRDMKPSIEGLPEAGWSLIAAAQGKGLATEVTAAMHGWSDANLSCDKTVCIIDPGNTVSIGLARRCGYGEPVDALYRDERILLLERSRGGA